MLWKQRRLKERQAAVAGEGFGCGCNCWSRGSMVVRGWSNGRGGTSMISVVGLQATKGDKRSLREDWAF
ncbi:hypothetical protein BHE74_00016598 [Ensete ventricosum]|nr:hypothetical protein BHE74_00016598 [Ensete ventricosum]RZR96522.1 hypothetical protein BHM03_00025554 [Ensete ventricosum]